MNQADLLGPIQIGNGSGQLQNTVIAASGKLEFIVNHFNKILAFLIQCAVAID